jgi:hypothetical protein
MAHAEEQLKAGYKLVTEGKFHDALKVFIRLLQVSQCLICGDMDGGSGSRLSGRVSGTDQKRLHFS